MDILLGFDCDHKRAAFVPFLRLSFFLIVQKDVFEGACYLVTVATTATTTRGRGRRVALGRCTTTAAAAAILSTG